MEDIFHLVNLRHLVIVAELPKTEFPSSIYNLWNLQTLVVNSDWSNDSSAPLFDIWKMPKLRHVKVYKLMLPDPPHDDGSLVLWNLQTLHGVYKFKCDEDVVKRIPNIKKLGIFYDSIEDLLTLAYYCLNNLGQLLKLESLSCFFRLGKKPSPSESPRNLITFPDSLKKLTLQGTGFIWEDMATKIVEDQFCRLKYLSIFCCRDLEYWRIESSHFPCLEHLSVAYSKRLKELPSEIGEIQTLKSIYVHDCSDSVVISAKKIQIDQEELGNESLQFKVHPSYRNQLQTEESSLTIQMQRRARLLESTWNEIVRKFGWGIRVGQLELDFLSGCLLQIAVLDAACILV